MSTTIETDEYIYLDGNDKIEQFDLTTPDSTTGEDTPATGLSSLTVHYSATKSGATIHASLTKTLAERSEVPGRYYATEEGSDITAQLTAYANQRIFAVVKDSGGNVLKSFPRFVKPNRYDG